MERRERHRPVREDGLRQPDRGASGLRELRNTEGAQVQRRTAGRYPRFEGDETFHVTLSGITGAGATLVDDTGIGTIIDDDPSPS